MRRLQVSQLAAAFLIIVTLALGVSRSASQKEGFYSINCGGEAYNDPNTSISWESDPFNNEDNDTLYGKATMVSSALKNIPNVMKSLRYFPNDSVNKKFCYSLQVSYESTYLLRASFLYGNYDGLNQPPKFVLIFNYDEWANVITSSSTTPIMHELTFVSSENELKICLAPFNSSHTPFISTLEIRLLENKMYTKNIKGQIPALELGYGLMLWQRINYGATTDTKIRYPDDAFDRIWDANTTGPTLSINASQVSVDYSRDPDKPPAKVMATAITTNHPDQNLSFTYDGYGGDIQFRIEMHFEELGPISRNMGIALPRSVSNENITFTPKRMPDAGTLDKQVQLAFPLEITFYPVLDSPLGPLLNAIELFRWTPQPLSINGTFESDVISIKEIQTYFKLVGYGQGDPCLPDGYAWTWIACSIDTPPRIIEINLASFHLTGNIPSSINNLTHLQKIDFSNNNLSGVIPNVNNLSDLKYLDLHNNNLVGEVPAYLVLLPKLASLDVSNNNLCGSSPTFQMLINYTNFGNKRLCDDITCSCNSSMSSNFSITSDLSEKKKKKRKYIVSISFLGALYIVSIFFILIIFLVTRKKRTKEEMSTSLIRGDKKGVDEIKGHPFIAKMFTYNEINDATFNFKTLLGEGGFGKVYHGLLSTGEAIAVKMLDDVSKQGLRDFYNEVAILSRVRHKNLVSLIGYCVEDTYMLIYEYVSKGNLRDFIYGEVESKDKPLSWVTRLHIAFDASQGLDYLHKACDPQIIHRDVKSSNILLTEKMQAKVSDFGISHLRQGDNTSSHVSTPNVVGTIGYLDPAYNATNQFTDKSDVYSFGIVLFELVCGRAPIDMMTVPPHIVDWALETIEEGKVEDIVDPMLQNGYKKESMRKVVDVAFGCVQKDRMKRLKMSQVSQVLQNALEIEMDQEISQEYSASSSTLHSWSLN